MSKTASATTKRAAPKSAVYLYALVRSGKAPTLGRAPKGLEGLGKVRAIECGEGLWLVAADAPLAQYSGEAIERQLRDMEWVAARALGHEQVVEHLAGRFPAVPMKLFTLFASDERAAAHIAAERAKLIRVLDRVEGCAEWGVRVTFDEAGARKRAQSEARSEARPGASGTAFLLQKKKEKDIARVLLHDAQAEVDALFDSLSSKSRLARRRAPGPAEVGARILLEAAFLVPEPRAAAFREFVAAREKALAPAGYAVTLTGPWPAYNFVAESA